MNDNEINDNINNTNCTINKEQIQINLKQIEKNNEDTNKINDSVSSQSFLEDESESEKSLLIKNSKKEIIHNSNENEDLSFGDEYEILDNDNYSTNKNNINKFKPTKRKQDEISTKSNKII